MFSTARTTRPKPLASSSGQEGQTRQQVRTAESSASPVYPMSPVRSADTLIGEGYRTRSPRSPVSLDNEMNETITQGRTRFTNLSPPGRTFHLDAQAGFSRPCAGDDQDRAASSGSCHQTPGSTQGQTRRDSAHDQSDGIAELGDHRRPTGNRHVANDEKSLENDTELDRRRGGRCLLVVDHRRPPTERRGRSSELKGYGHCAGAERAVEQHHRTQSDTAAGQQRPERAGHHEHAIDTRTRGLDGRRQCLE